MNRYKIRDLKRMSLRCDRLARESADLYYRGAMIGCSDEILEAAARLTMDIAAIHNRVSALRHPTGGAGLKPARTA